MTHRDFCPAEDCVQRMLEVQAERAPGALAAVLGPERVTYQELNRRVNQLTAYIMGLGVGPEALVALCAERSLEALVGLLAVLKAGGAYVPMDPAYPRARIAWMLADVVAASARGPRAGRRAPVLLTQARLIPSLPPHGARVVLLDGDRDAIARCSDENPPPAASPDHLAYVIYTSGSTGKPKGVMLSHRGLTRLARALLERFDLGPGRRVLQLASLGFDASVWEMVMALASGATLVLGTRAEMMPGFELVRRMREEQVSIATFPPSVLAALPEGAERSLPALRTLVVAGEACPPELVARWAPGRRFFNAYGPTEVTVCATVAACAAPDPGALQAQPPIGQPFADARCFVLDAAMRPVPEGARGELYVGGAGLARGYLDRPALTAERFVPDPFNARQGARLYRTGDVVRKLPEGDLAFLGRVDDQVKIRGHRVELGEVEAALASHPEVRAAAVVAREGRLCAYVVARATAQPAAPQAPLEQALRRHLREKLPEPMVPSTFTALDALPLTPSGKVDRAALPAPSEAPAPREDEAASPPREIEATLARVWAEALGLERVGVHEDVFALGAHSLLAARVQSRLRDALGVELPLARVLEATTVAALAGVVAPLHRPGQPAGPAPIRPAPRDRPIPLSYGQHQIWLHASLHPGGLFYNEPFSFRMAGPLDAPALSRALSALVRRHEILRTTFVDAGGAPEQRVHPPAPLHLPTADLTVLPAEARWARAVALATDEARRPFDLARGPLLRATLVKLCDADHVLFVVAHHIVWDGVSIFEVLQNELRALYQALSAGAPPALPDLPIQYADYAVWQRARGTGAAREAHLEFWRRRLAGLPTLELPTDRPRPAIPSFRGARHRLALSRDLTLRLKAVARTQGVTLFVVLLSAFKALLRRYTRQAEIVVGTTASCRDRPEIEGLLGFFLNSLVLRTDLRGDPTFRELLGRVQEVTRAALSHQEVPFADVVEALRPRRVPGQNPLFQVAFVLEPPAPAIAPGWSLSQLDVDTGASKFDLTLELDERPEGILGRLEYSTDLFDARTIERMAGHYEILLEAAAKDVDARVSALPLLAPDERRALREASVAPAGPGADACIHHLFEAEVARSPEAVAVVFDGGAGSSSSLTYRELSRRANRLAHHLLGLGVQPEDRVAICMYRSLDLLVAILGVLKAGLCFVPMDPAYPTERLAFILDQADARVLIASADIAGMLPARRARALCMDAIEGALAQEPDGDPSVPSSPDQLAYVMYTSGSTGRPKGVAVPHRGVARLVKGTSYARFSSEEVFLQFASMAFDASQLEIWGALLHGGRLVVMPSAPTSLEDLGRVIREHGVTTAWLTASVFHLLVDTRIDDLRGLRQILAGGDVLSPQHVNRVITELPSCRMINGYGPTEAATFACCATVARPVDGAVPIGRPIPGTRAHVLDEHFREVPDFVPGELCIGGEGLARGYVGRPDLTAERFLPDPIGRAPGGRLYRTGDRVRRRPDGQLEFLGRMDHQVKVRGFRIELGEIEAILRAHPDVRDAVVTAQPDRAGDKRLTGYVVPQAGAAPPGGLQHALLDHLRSRLPDYMVPSAILPLSALPLTENGKVDRAALPAAEVAHAADAPIGAPRSQLEERLAALWQEVLGVERVDVHDSFFDLGGHSLLLMRLHELIRESFGGGLSIVDLFARPTIRDLATYLSGGAGDGDLSEVDARIRKQRETLKRKKQAAARAKGKPHGSA